MVISFEAEELQRRRLHVEVEVEVGSEIEVAVEVGGEILGRADEIVEDDGGDEEEEEGEAGTPCTPVPH